MTSTVEKLLGAPHYWFAEFVRGQRENNPTLLAAASRELLKLGYKVEIVEVKQ